MAEATTVELTETQLFPQSEKINASVERYLAWRKGLSEGLKESDYGWNRAIESGRANVWCHATSLEGAIKTLSSGFLKSAQTVLVEGGTLKHAPTNREGKPPESIQEGATFSNMRPGEKDRALRWAREYLAGALGRMLEKYTHKSDTRLQAGFIFPLETILAVKGVDLFPNTFRGLSSDLPLLIELEQARLKHLPPSLSADEYGISVNEPGVLEINLGNMNFAGEPTPTRISAEGSILLVREDQVAQVSEEIRRRMAKAGKSQEQIEHALKKIVGFSKKFQSIDEAVGWLTNTPEGQEIVQSKTGVDISKIPQAHIEPETSYLSMFIRDNQETIIRLQERLGNPSRWRLDEGLMYRHQSEIEYRRNLIRKLEEKYWENAKLEDTDKT